LDSFTGAVLAGAAAFAATNVDDLFLLVAFFAAGTYRAREVILGQYAGISLLYAASAAASLVSLVIPASYLSLLGLVPMLIGLKQIFRQDTREETVPVVSGVLSVTTVTVANGGDNIAVYTPLFAMSSAQAIGAIGAVFAVMTALWCFAARWLLHHPYAAALVRRYGPRLAPFALITIGLAILLY
jgi:cadmium resistance protein CadD (predicted permease)